MSWSDAEIRELKRLAKSKEYFYTEIAEKLQKNPQLVRWKAKKIGLPRKPCAEPIGGWNRKHGHLRERVMRYFLTHSMDQTRKHFGLTLSEAKSLFTAGYRDPKLKHLRKDARRKDPWTNEELLFVIRHSGLRPRSWIGKKLKRGGSRVIKERLQTFNSGTKWLNGMPWKWACELWGEENIPRFIKTDAGPGGGKLRGDFHFKVVPWTTCDSIASKVKTDPTVKSNIRAMARFQKWIHGLNTERGVTRRIREICR